MKIFIMLCSLWCVFCAEHALAKDGMLLVMFGTSYESAEKALNDITDAYKEVYAGTAEIEIAYTSEFIRRKLKQNGKHIYSVDEALHALAKKGVSNLSIQSFHVAPAAEYNETERLVVKHLIMNPQHFTTARLGAPLLSSFKDMQDVVATVLQAIPKERTPQEAVLFMGHGNNHGPGDLVLQATASSLNAADSNVYLACVEGALTFDAVLEELKEKKIKSVWLMPFMIVAGDHAINDMIGTEADSWASMLQKAGMGVRSRLIGLGQLEGIRNIFLRHTKDAYLDVAHIRHAD